MSDFTPAGVKSGLPIDSFATLNSMKMRPDLKIIAAALLLFSFGLLLIHFHAGHENHQDCPACRLIQIFSLGFSLIVVFLIQFSKNSAALFLSENDSLPRFFFRRTLADRAPPVLS